MKKSLVKRYDLSLVPEDFMYMAVKSLLRDEIDGVLCMIDNMLGFEFLKKNWDELKQDGLLEEAFLYAYTSPRANVQHVQASVIMFMASHCNRDKLQACCDKMPEGDSFTLFRGIAGNGAKRRKRGLSWTGDFEKAKWFATRYMEKHRIACPAVVQAIVPRESVLFYTNERNEDEYVCLLEMDCPIKTVWRNREE